MRDCDLYAKILNLSEPWTVVDVELDLKGKSVTVRLGRRDDAGLECPECGRACPGYDSQPRRWRHLDTCQFQTILVADVPRCSCPEHGVKQVRVPWAEPGSRFSVLFECLAIDWMRECGRSATARQLKLSWSEADGIMQRAVDRGLARRPAATTAVLGVDDLVVVHSGKATLVARKDQLDKLKGLQGKDFAKHDVVDHSRGEYSYKDRLSGIKVGINSAEGYYSVFKRDMKGVFLSYASDDAPAAARICAALRAAGIEVWFDQSELRGGDAWDAAIRRVQRISWVEDGLLASADDEGLPADGVLTGVGTVEVDIFGQWVEALVTREPLFDPAGDRVRG